jgi:hypothetical protein
VRPTCGGWDGLSCGPNPSTAGTDQQAEAEFARIDGDARSICPEDYERLQVYLGSVQSVIQATDGALRHADDVARRLEEFRDKHGAAAWAVRTLSREGVLYDCIWNSLRNATPTFFTPHQQALLNKLSGTQQQIDDTKNQVQAQWLSTRDQYLEVLAAKILTSYVTAALLAHRYAIEGFDLTRARERLNIVSATLGETAVRRLLSHVPDPTDPAPTSGRRSLGEVSLAILTGGP